jgi:mannose-6-phosphate isomerase-like protein (cupin superfamily)
MENAMLRPVLTTALSAALTAAALPALAQAPASPAPAAPAAAPAPQPDIIYAAADQAMALLAKAKAERKEGQAMAPAQPLVRIPGYRAIVEYRASPTPASLHKTNNELIQVIDGSGTLIVGGTLNEARDTNPANQQGTGVTGGQTYTLAKGAYVFVPAGTAHSFATIGPAGLGIVTLYVPKPPTP